MRKINREELNRILEEEEMGIRADLSYVDLSDFDLSNIDWLECENLALGNLVKEICDYWHEHKEINGENISTVNMSNIFGLTKNTIGKYLKKGTKLNWCNYDPNEELGKNFTRNKNIDK